MSRAAHIIAGFEELVDKGLIDGYQRMSPEGAPESRWFVQVDDRHQAYMTGKEARILLGVLLAVAERLRV